MSINKTNEHFVTQNRNILFKAKNIKFSNKEAINLSIPAICLIKLSFYL